MTSLLHTSYSMLSCGRIRVRSKGMTSFGGKAINSEASLPVTGAFRYLGGSFKYRGNARILAQLCNRSTTENCTVKARH